MATGNILITGCDSGFGLELVRYLNNLNEVKRIFAGCMDLDKTPELKQISAHPKITLIELRVHDDKSIEKAKSQIESVIVPEGLNLLINNAGIHKHDDWLKGEPKRDVFLEHYNVNTIGPVMVTGAFLPLLQTAAKLSNKAMVLNISSDLASAKVALTYQCTVPKVAGIIAYGMTKCALNHFTRTLAYYETKNGIICIAVHPGIMRTQMAGFVGEIEPEEAAKIVIGVINKLTIADSGRYIDNRGNDLEL